MRIPALAPFVVTIALATAPQAALVQPTKRVWTDSTGRKAEMTLVAVEAGTAEFRKADGGTLKLPVVKLSSEDQRLVRELGGHGGAGDSGNREWPDSVEVSKEDIEVEVVAEEEHKPLGHIYRTAHFEFHSEADLGIAVMKDVGRVFEATRELLVQAPWRIEPEPPGEYFLAELYATRDSYVAAGAPENSGGVFFRDREKFLVPVQSLGLKPVGRRYGMAADYNVETLVHELTHQMMREWLYVLPMWFVEGSAEYTSIFPYNAGKFRCSGIKVALKDYVRTRKQIGLSPRVEKVDDLLRMTNAEWHANAAMGYRVQAELYYDSLLLTYYFLHLDGDGDGRRFYAWLDSVRATKKEVAGYFRAMEEFQKQDGVTTNADGILSYPSNLTPPSPPDILASREALEAAGSSHLEILMDGRTEQELKQQIRDAYSAIGVR